MIIKGQGIDHELLVDAESEINDYKWHAIKDGNTFYARGYLKGIPVRSQKMIMVHQLIMGPPPPGYTIDHENRNGLDCRRENLRFITYSGNTRNKKCNNATGYMGVRFDKRLDRNPQRRYQATITIAGKNRSIGTFDTAKEAGRYAAKARAEQLKTEVL